MVCSDSQMFTFPRVVGEERVGTLKKFVVPVVQAVLPLELSVMSNTVVPDEHLVSATCMQCPSQQAQKIEQLVDLCDCELALNVHQPTIKIVVLS